MYKVIIVDDECFAAKLLEKYIAEFAEEFEVVSVFDDGADAIKYLSSGGEADVIMTEIKMRKMSGLTLAKYAYERNRNTKVVFVSAYADFESAREEMSGNVFGCLLKVIDIGEFSQMMAALKKKLDSEKMESTVN